MMIEAAVARHLTDLVDDLTYTPAGAGGNVSIEAMASTPDLYCTVLAWGSNPVDGAELHPYDEPTIQVAVRSDPHRSREARAVAQAAYDALIGLTSTVIAEGTDDEVYVVLVKQGTPVIRIGPPDDNHRSTYGFNVAVHHLAPTTNRPL